MADLSIWGRIQPKIHFLYRRCPPATAAGATAVLKGQLHGRAEIFKGLKMTDLSIWGRIQPKIHF